MAQDSSIVLSESLRIPFPKYQTTIEILKRDTSGKFIQLLQQVFSLPESPETMPPPIQAEIVTIHGQKDYDKAIDILFIPDGYQANELEDFVKDCHTLKEGMFSWSPYSGFVDKINIKAALVASEDSGVEDPILNNSKNTIIQSSFYTLETERYLTPRDNISLQNIASLHPHDQIVILVNTDKYGGGGIYNQYAILSAKSDRSVFLFLHEFGHSFAGLGDEYAAEQTQSAGYPHTLEPWQPNLTTLVHFDRKWHKLVDKDTPIPTPESEQYENKVGAFEGANYEAKNMFRPFQNCSMNTVLNNSFCPVCKKHISNMINLHSK